jgi:hypothetical protein
MPNKKRSDRKKKTPFIEQAKTDLANLLKTKKKLDAELRYVKKDLKRMMMHIHHGPPFPRPKRPK